MSARMSTLKPVIRPSLVAVRVRSWIWSRPLWPLRSDSLRLSAYFTGLPSAWPIMNVASAAGRCRVEDPRVRLVGRAVGVGQRSTVRDGRFHVEHHRQVRVVDLD